MRSLAPSPAAPRHRVGQAGFTLLELMIVVAILAIVASVGVPQYVSALRIARIGKSKQELQTISHAIDAYNVNHGGQLPLTLHQVGFGGKRDPWGVPYCYLNYGDGTGDGLDWAIEAGLVDPNAVKSNTGASGGGAAAASATPPRHGSFDIVGALWRRPQEAAAAADAEGRGAAVAAARGVAAAVVAELARPIASTEVTELATSLASAGAFRVFAGVPTEVTRRRDRFLFPLNNDYDLFSLGPDGRTTVALGESLGQDDVIRANNGGFFGTASEY